MKKTFTLLSTCVLIIQLTSAQLKVTNNGNVGIKTEGNTPLSNLVVGGHPGSTGAKITVYGNGTVNALTVIRGNVTSTWSQAIFGLAPVTQGSKTMGVYGASFSDSPTNTGRAFGTLGYAGNATSGYNYGAMGMLMGEGFGAGVLGSHDAMGDSYISGRYAGYFRGNVAVTGYINGITVGSSDIRYKQNIVDLKEISAEKSRSGNGILSTILQMNPVQYNLKQVYFEPESDTASVKQGYFDETSVAFKKKHYGLIAQDLQKLYPDLVYESDNGYLNINYTGIIPLLIQSIKELKAELDELKASPVRKNAAKSPSNITPDENGQATLYQNTPNPFTQNTQIRYYLPTTVATAYLCVYNLQGKQLKQYLLTERGEQLTTISGSEFSAGIYLYALLADGKEVDIKRMILTE